MCQDCNQIFWQPKCNEFLDFLFNKNCVLMVTNQLKILLTIIINFKNYCFVIGKF